ncbi:hypothetical protein [Anaerorhabdus sp.]|uniref:hypothetical protein n=1 Tax=Anaerorhabdus sp. TaxID=1872524 RepID=UPI002FC6FD9F
MTNLDLKKLLDCFMVEVANGNVEIYNEASLQYELGIYLRSNINDFSIQFERNTKYFGEDKCVKHEIDLVIFNKFKKYAIELKFSKNGQIPETIYSCIKDIEFMEELKKRGFDKTYCITLIEQPHFYLGKKRDGIYFFFRDNIPIHGKIRKPTGKTNETLLIEGYYKATWCGENGIRRYYLIEIGG